MNHEKLGKLFSIASGGTPSRNKPEYFSNGHIPWVKTGDLGKKIVTEPLEKISQLGLENSSAKLFPAKTVLVAMYGATIGSCAILDFEACTNQACAAFLPCEKVNHEYFYYFLRSIKQRLIALGQGGGQPNISATLLKSIEMPVPSLDDQIRIAHLLSKVEGLIAQRKQHLQQLDDLLESVFLEMFGDLSASEQGFDWYALDKIKAPERGSFSNGPFGSDLLTSELSETGEVPVIYIRDIRDSCFNWISNVFVTREKARSLSNCRVTIGDILVSKVGDPPGTAAINYQFSDAIITQDVIRLRPDTSLANPYFVQRLLNSSYGKWLIKKITIKGTRSRFPLRTFKELEVPLPPIGLQDHFAAIVKQVEGIKSHYQQNLTQLENLYGALSQKAFKGELDLSRVPLKPITANLNIQEEGDTLVATATVKDLPQAIDLPDVENMLELLATIDGRERILKHWLESYVAQLKSSAFSVNNFLGAAQVRMAELHPENDFELGISEYEQLKGWVFEQIEEGKLKQTRNIIVVNERQQFGNQVILRARISR